MLPLWRALNAEVTGCAEERTPAMQGHTASSRPSAASQRASTLDCCWTTHAYRPDEPAGSAEEPLEGDDLKSVPLGAGTPSRSPLLIYSTAIAAADAEVSTLQAQLQGTVLTAHLRFPA